MLGCPDIHASCHRALPVQGDNYRHLDEGYDDMPGKSCSCCPRLCDTVTLIACLCVTCLKPPKQAVTCRRILAPYHCTVLYSIPKTVVTAFCVMYCICVTATAAHVKASLMGSSLTVPIADGRLALGTWQVSVLTSTDLCIQGVLLCGTSHPSCVVVLTCSATWCAVPCFAGNLVERASRLGRFPQAGYHYSRSEKALTGHWHHSLSHAHLQ